MTVWLYVVGIKSEIIEVRELDDDVSQRLHEWGWGSATYII